MWLFLTILLSICVSIVAIFSRVEERNKKLAQEAGNFSADDFEILE